MNVTANEIAFNPFRGLLFLVGSSNDTAQGNNITGNGNGIHLAGTTNDTIADNVISANTMNGIFLFTTSVNNTFRNNTVVGNGNGTVISSGNNNNTFIGNRFVGNAYYGLNVTSGAESNLFYNNSFSLNPWSNASDAGRFNRWDNGSLGNYWGNYAGRDINDDGFGDTPEIVNGSAGAVDHFPIWDDGEDQPPVLSVQAPAGNQLCGAGTPSFVISVYDPDLAAVWYTLDEGKTTFKLFLLFERN